MKVLVDERLVHVLEKASGLRIHGSHPLLISISETEKLERMLNVTFAYDTKFSAANKHRIMHTQVVEFKNDYEYTALLLKTE